jgi:hypothetical protein
MRFLDGPAKGTVLNLQRAPLQFRVVIDRDGTVDALDQLDDSPKPSEAIHVYLRQGAATCYHVLCTPRRLSGWRVAADYLLYDRQPNDDVARDEHAWREWAARRLKTDDFLSREARTSEAQAADLTSLQNELAALAANEQGVRNCARQAHTLGQAAPAEMPIGAPSTSAAEPPRSAAPAAGNS